jgi:glycosyltransferase involved in cell wall biosynthesis
MTDPSVSIVLPTRNGAGFLRESIDSCLMQTFTDWQLIIVDDGSTDATGAIVADFSAHDRRIVLITHHQPRGLPRSLNAGFARATGKYFSWTSDDNRYRRHALERLVATLTADDDIDLVYSDYSVMDDAGVIGERRIALPPDRLVVANCVGASFIYRRTIHERLGGYDPSRPLVEDYDFWLRAAAAQFRLLPLNEDLYLYRLHRGSLSTGNEPAILSAHRELLRARLATMAWPPPDTRAAACVHLARVALQRGDRSSALSDLLLGCRIDPVAVVADCARRAYHGALRRVEAA